MFFSITTAQSSLLHRTGAVSGEHRVTSHLRAARQPGRMGAATEQIAAILATRHRISYRDEDVSFSHHQSDIIEYWEIYGAC